MGNEPPVKRCKSKRPSFHLDVDSSEDEIEHSQLPSTANNNAGPSSTTPTNPIDQAILRFSSESLHSFSYASISQNSISQRISVLKRSLEFLKENPLMLRDLQRSLSSVSLDSTAQAFTERSGVLRQVLSNIRSSASSATLSMLNSISSSSGIATAESNNGSNPKAGLYKTGGPGVDRNAHYTPGNTTPRAVSGGAVISGSEWQKSMGPPENPFNENLEKVLETLENAYSSRDRVDMLFASPGLPFQKEGALSKKPTTNIEQPPAAGHQRALTSSSAVNIESQILEALATPYIDVAWQSMIQRSGSISSVPAMINSVSTLSLASHGCAADTTATPTITPLSSVASKYASKHSIFTTKDSTPFQILSSNDIACLVFGISQREMRSRSLLDIIESSAHHKLVDDLAGCSAKTVPICGAIFPITKSNGHESAASFWVKYNSQGLLIWVIEEVLLDRAKLELDENRCVVSVSGTNHESLVDGTGQPIDELLPRGVPGAATDTSSGTTTTTTETTTTTNTTFNAYNTILYNEKHIPGFTRLADDKRSVELMSLPHMAGVIILNKSDLKITDYNKVFLENLLGYHQSKSLTGESIDKLIPQFSIYLGVISDVHKLDTAFDNTGLVIPEHMFRKAAAMSRPNTVPPEAGVGARSESVPKEVQKAQGSSPQRPKLSRTTTSPLPSTTNLDGWKLPEPPAPNADQELIDRYGRFVSSTGIEARNIHGDAITVDVQLRVVSPSYFALWVTYSRNIREFRAQSEVPSQLKLFYELQNQRKKTKSSSESPSEHSRNSSLSQSSDSTPSLTTESSHNTLGSPPSPHNASEGAVSGGGTYIDMVEYAKHTPEIGGKRRTKKIGEFEILSKMGEGAYGKVLLAQYIEEPRITVVIKCVIKERILVDTWTRDRKLGTIPNEIKVMVTLNSHPHPNIIRLLDFFEDDDYYHIEMERHGNPGTDLFDLIELKPNMDEAECKSIFGQVVSAVSHLHGHGIVHRDIKDENVVVDDASGALKLIDYGSSAFIKQGPFDVFVGTIDYAAPEVLAGRPYSGKPQDIWALGILLYTIVYKENPFYNVDEIMDGDLRIPYVTSAACLDLVNLILRRDVDKRPTIEDIKKHEWLVGFV